MAPVPVAEARDKQAVGPELLRERIKRPGGARREPGKDVGGDRKSGMGEPWGLSLPLMANADLLGV